MKSAFELALERSGGSLNQVPDAVKKELAELDTLYASRIAAAELAAEHKRAQSDDPDAIRELQEGLALELASLREACENKKNAVRKNAGV